MVRWPRAPDPWDELLSLDGVLGRLERPGAHLIYSGGLTTEEIAEASGAPTVSDSSSIPGNGCTWK